MTTNHVVLAFGGEQSAKTYVIQGCLTTLRQRGYNVLFAKSTPHLDIDTPNKDSYELFEAGLDFAMLVTDKQRYLKSRHDVSQHLSIPPDTDWVIQDGAIYPSDIRLSLTENATILTECGREFPQYPLAALIDWLEQNEK